MNDYSQQVLKYKPEFSYLDTDKPLAQTYSDGTKNEFNPKLFPYADKFLNSVISRVYDTYSAVVDEDKRELVAQELYAQLAKDFRFDFSDHLGGMRQRDKRGAGTDVYENDYNMFHSCYKFVNQAARAKTFGEKFNLSLMSGRVNSDNQTGPEIYDPFVFGAPLYLYSKSYVKALAMSLPGYDTPEKIKTLLMHEKEIKKGMFEVKAHAAKQLKAQWHYLINKKFMPQGMEFKDLTVETVKKLSELHKDMLTELSSQVENHFQQDVKRLKKLCSLLNKQMVFHQNIGTPADDLAAIQLASVHAMQANEVLNGSSVVQLSIEAEKMSYNLMADVLEDDNSLTAKIFDNPHTRKVFETEMQNIHTTKAGEGYNSLLDKLDNMNSAKFPEYTRMLGQEVEGNLSRQQIAQALRSGKAMPKVSFMLAVLLLETGAKIEGGSSQIVYARRIQESLNKVFEETRKFAEFNHEDVALRQQVIASFDYRTAQAQIWGVKENGDALGYRNLLDGTVRVNDELLDAVANVASNDAFDGAVVHRFYSHVTKQPMNEDEFALQKNRVKNKLLTFADKGDYTQLLAPKSEMYNRLATIIKQDENVQNNQMNMLKFNHFGKVAGL